MENKHLSLELKITLLVKEKWLDLSCHRKNKKIKL